jgi:hypothetical protein
LIFGALVAAPPAGFEVGLPEGAAALVVALLAFAVVAGAELALPLGADALAEGAPLDAGSAVVAGAASLVVAGAAVTLALGSAVVAGSALAVAVTFGVAVTVVPGLAFAVPSSTGRCFDRHRKKPPAAAPAITTAIRIPTITGPIVDGGLTGFAAASDTAFAVDEGDPEAGPPAEAGTPAEIGTDSDAAENDPGVIPCWSACCCVGMPIGCCGKLGCDVAAAAAKLPDMSGALVGCITCETPIACASAFTCAVAFWKRCSGSRLHAFANHSSKRGPRCGAFLLGGSIGSYTICPMSAAMPSAVQ